MKRLIILLLLFVPYTLWGTRYYVSTSGDDANNGITEGTAWATLAYAEANATTAGDTICLKKGDTWTLTSILNINSGGNAENTIVWDGHIWGDGANAIITTNTNYFGTLFRIANCDYLTIQYITFDAAENQSHGIIIGGPHTTYGGDAQNNEDHITIQNCSFQNIGNTGADIHGIVVQTWVNNMTYITIQHNTFSNMQASCIYYYPGRTAMGATPAMIDGGYVGYNTCNTYSNGGSGYAILINNRTRNIIVENNTTDITDDRTGYGIVVSSNEEVTGYYPTNVIIRNNDIRTYNRAAMFIQKGQEISVDIYCNKFYRATETSNGGTIRITVPDSIARNYDGADIKIYNNTIITNGTNGSCYTEETQSDNYIVDFKNNLMINTNGTSGFGVYNVYSATATSHSHNSYYRGNGENVIYYLRSSPYITYNRSDSTTIESTGVFSDPRITDINNFDWTLAVGSPAIAAGIGVGLNTDKAGNAWATTPSIGAYEYDATPPTPTDLPEVTTTAITTYYSVQATGAGNVTSDGGGTITARGVCWGTSPNPTTSNAKFILGGTTGTFSGTMRGLSGGTTYHYRAFATNESGTSYGANLSFTTPTYTNLKSGSYNLIYNGKTVIIK